MEAITSKETVEVLNDLVKINNDRIEGYEKALKELKDEDADLKPLFLKFIDQSRQIRMVLGTELQALGGDMEKGTTGSGSLYRTWMEVKATFTGHTRHAVLAACEYGEDAAQKAYETALNTEHVPAHLVDTLTDEKQRLREAHDEVKRLRDKSAKSN
jgi:uncharacterized protein (TIGR02284 family)